MSAMVEKPAAANSAARFAKTDFVRKKERRERVARAIFLVMALLMIAPLVLIVGYLFYRAAPVLSLDFLFKVPIRGMREGGIWPALLGTVYLVLISLAVAAPIGVLAAVYLNEYAKENWFTRVVNLAVVNLAGVPSIVHALFGLGAFVAFAGIGVRGGEQAIEHAHFSGEARRHRQPVDRGLGLDAVLAG